MKAMEDLNLQSSIYNRFEEKTPGKILYETLPHMSNIQLQD